ncbi:hypothetical protein [Allosphingosinicella deserti]|uniref:Uncharacterized protein n=1 Tax=Allosphingosinicella deserti TaxID=2116704 RepID=A0A2P7QLK9_9SPHN|nr:hypothetical protein [Sphingomonas deserti]PSJ38851.1 hypothetical protein C7I55_16115 [Sphingomonas deserti]
MEATSSFYALANSLSGQPVSYVWRGYGSAVFIEFGKLTPRANRDGSPGHPKGEVSLGVKWSWRIEDETGILCGSWSDEEIWEGSLARLRDRRVKGLALFSRLPEVELVTEDDTHFLSFSTTEGQPQWHLVDRRTDPALWFTVRAGQLHLGDGSEPAF